MQVGWDSGYVGELADFAACILSGAIVLTFLLTFPLAFTFAFAHSFLTFWTALRRRAAAAGGGKGRCCGSKGHADHDESLEDKAMGEGC